MIGKFEPIGEGMISETQDRACYLGLTRLARQEVKRMIAGQNYAMVVAEELAKASPCDYPPLSEVHYLVEARAPIEDILLTGRNAPQGLIGAHDFVTKATAVECLLQSQSLKALAGIAF